MKYPYKVVCIVCLLSIFLVSTLCGCQQDLNELKNLSHKVSIKKDKKPKIGISFPSERDEQWVKYKQIMEEDSRKMSIDIITDFADNDIEKQTSQCEKLISDNIDVLIIVPVSSKDAKKIVEKAHENKIKVLCLDRLINDADVDLYITFDSRKAGELQAQYITNIVKKGNVVILTGDRGDNNSRLLREGAMDILKPYIDRGDIEIIFEHECKNWSALEAANHIKTALIRTNNNIQAVLAPNDNIALGTIEALTSVGLDGKVAVTGQDAQLNAIKHINKGTQLMTLFKDPSKAGKEALQAAVKLLENEDPGINNKENNNKIDVPTILFSPKLVDKDNINQVLINSGYYNLREVAG